MKIDTSSYYPKSSLDDEEPASSSSIFPASTDEKKEIEEAVADGVVSSSESKKESETSVPFNGSAPDEFYDPSETERFIDSLSTFLSWVLVPLLMPVYGAIMAFNLSSLDLMPFRAKLAFTLIIAGFNMALPALLILLLKKMGVVDDLGLNGRKERFIPYIITILCMGATGFFMYIKHAPMWFVFFFVGGAMAGLINLIINFRWKISAHSAGIAGIAAMLVWLMRLPLSAPGVLAWLIVTIAACGLLGSARVWLGRHTAAQVMAGYVVGFLSVFFSIMFVV